MAKKKKSGIIPWINSTNESGEMKPIPLNSPQAEWLNDMINRVFIIGQQGDWLLIGTEISGRNVYLHKDTRKLGLFYVN